MIANLDADKGKPVTFTLQVPAGTAAGPAKKITDSVRLWKDPEKNTALGDGRLPEDVTVPADKQEVDLWVEGDEISDAVGDIKIALASGATEHDKVTLTFVWADFVKALHDRATFDDVLKDAEFKDLTEPPKKRIRALGGVGLRDASEEVGIRNVILMKFRVRPSTVIPPRATSPAAKVNFSR
jgi:hypothetical protein